MKQTQIDEIVAKVPELGECVKRKRIAEEAERERLIAAENAAIKEAEEKAQREEEERKQAEVKVQQQELTKEADENSTEITNLSTIPGGVRYAPGTEQVEIKKHINILFDELDRAFPDKVIVGLHKGNLKWIPTIRGLRRLLGYPDENSFLTAYGYSVGTGTPRRSNSVDPDAIIARLKKISSKAAHQSRNRNMVDRSDLVVFYVEHEYGGTWQTMKYAVNQK